MKKVAVVAMSGGVDSSVAALLLQEQGYRVLGVTLRLYDSCGSAGAKSCCGLEDAVDAREVAAKLGIEHRVLEHQEAFRRLVVEPFARAYAEGRTPNPCITCNERVKFGTLWEYARAAGADLLATGHHARLVRSDGEVWLCRGRDTEKDQSYVLFPLTREQRSRTLLPVGELTKSEVRERARELGLPTADKPESQDICFAGRGEGYVPVVERELGDGLPSPGEVVHEDGRVLGRHGGIHRFTVGQRHGLGIPSQAPLFVTALDPLRAQVRVGPRAALAVRRFTVTGWNWHAPEGERPQEAAVQVRYRQEPVPARLIEREDGVLIEWMTAPRSVTPGQAAVAYAGDTVVGGGWIEGRSP
jgi:tRNA-specific 2-thiouridylase